jgi:hypothetical protein
MNREKIWLSLAQMSGYEMQFIQSAFDTNWIAPLGPNVIDFENRLEKYVYQVEPEGRVVMFKIPAAPNPNNVNNSGDIINFLL